MDSLNGLQAGPPVRIGTPSVATHWLPPIIKEFQKDCPNIDYALLLGVYGDRWVLPGSPRGPTPEAARHESARRSS